MLRLKEKYQKEVIPLLKKEFGYRNDLAVPRVEKVVVNTSFARLLGDSKKDKADKILQEIEKDLALITGQKPALRKAKKSIAGFHLREGAPIGYQSTLRGGRMYDFLERLIYLTLPRTRDFQGIDPASLDGEGNLTIGFEEQLVFPEISAEEERRSFGLGITIVTTTKDKEKAKKLLDLLGFPWKK
jgi:large subunit ribosomal protein L5